MHKVEQFIAPYTNLSESCPESHGKVTRRKAIESIMKIIISPAKKMNIDMDSLYAERLPVFISETEMILAWMQKLSFAEAKKLWGCNEKLAELNFLRLQKMNLYQNLTPAVLSYEGIQFQYMAPSVFTRDALDYIREHLRILSGFYGVLGPFDGVTPYRLEMQAKAMIGQKRNLYQFWGDKLYREVTQEDGIIVNLASREYSRCIEVFLSPKDTFLTCTFAEQVDGRVVQKGTLAKMARGEMVRFMAENHVKKKEQLKEFQGLGYRFQRALSMENEYVYLLDKQVKVDGGE